MGRWGRGYSRPTQTQNANICPNFHFRGGGEEYSRPTQTQSANICPNFHFRGRGGVVLQTNSNSKCQHLPKFSLGGGLVIQTNSNSKCQHLPKFPWGGGGGGAGATPDQLKLKVPNFHGEGGVLQTNIPEILEWGHSRNFEHKFIILEIATASKIVSHTHYVCGD